MQFRGRTLQRCGWSQRSSCTRERKQMCTSQKGNTSPQPPCHSNERRLRGHCRSQSHREQQPGNPSTPSRHTLSSVVQLASPPTHPPLIGKEPRFLNPHCGIRGGIDSLSLSLPSASSFSSIYNHLCSVFPLPSPRWLPLLETEEALLPWGRMRLRPDWWGLLWCRKSVVQPTRMIDFFLKHHSVTLRLRSPLVTRWHLMMNALYSFTFTFQSCPLVLL